MEMINKNHIALCKKCQIPPRLMGTSNFTSFLKCPKCGQESDEYRGMWQEVDARIKWEKKNRIKRTTK